MRATNGCFSSRRINREIYDVKTYLFSEVVFVFEVHTGVVIRVKLCFRESVIAVPFEHFEEGSIAQLQDVNHINCLCVHLDFKLRSLF